MSYSMCLLQSAGDTQKNVRNTNHHYFSKSIAVHLQSVLQYAPRWYCSTSGVTELSGKGNTSVLLPFVSQYASHLYRNAFGKILVVVVTGMFPRYCHEGCKALLAQLWRCNGVAGSLAPDVMRRVE